MSQFNTPPAVASVVHNITSTFAGTPGNGYIVIDGNFENLFVPGAGSVIQPTTLLISASAGNDGQYTVRSSAYNAVSDKTTIYVTVNVPYTTVSSGTLSIIYTPSYRIDFSDPSKKPAIYIKPLTIDGPLVFVEGTSGETSVDENPVSRTCLDLPGRGTSNYGELLLQNLVRLTEHFSSTTEPHSPTLGQLWYDTTIGTLKLRTLDTLNAPTWTPILAGALSICGYTHDVIQSSPQATWIINHNLASTNVNVQTYVYNGSVLELALPYSVEITDLNTVTVKFTSPMSGKAVIIANNDSSTIPPPPTGILTAGNGLEINSSVLSVLASGNFNLSSGTLDLSTVNGLIPGTYNSVVVNTYGRVVGASNIDAAAGYYLPIGGGTVTGNLFGRAFRAAKGLPTNDSSTVGYAFGTDGDTGLFANGTQGSPLDTTQLYLHFNSQKAYTFNSNGNLDLNLGIIQKTTANGTTRWLQQDGSGRQHWYWNTTGSTTPTFEVAGEDATDIMHSSSSGNPFFKLRAASGVGKNAGDALTWTDVIYADLLGTFTYKGSSVWHSTNLTNLSQLTNNMNFVQSNTIPTFTGGVVGVEGGQIQLAKAASGGLAYDTAIDVYGATLRIFEGGGQGRGVYIDFTACAANAGTNILTPSWSNILSKPTTLSGYGISANDSILSGTYVPLAGGTMTGGLTVPYIVANGALISNSTSPQVVLQDTDGLTAWLYNNGNHFFVLKGASLAAGNSVLANGTNPLDINLTDGSTTIGGSLTVYGDITLQTGKTINCDNWFRSTGQTGWYNATYGGGIYMTDTTYVKTYNNKHLYVLSSAANVEAITGITGASVSAYAVKGQPGNPGYGGVIGFSQNGAVYGILGHANAYALYGAGAIYVTGDITGLSDQRKKTNVQTIENALEIVDAMRGVRFDWIDTGKKSVGVIAQEVQAVLPELVHENPDGDLSVAYGNLTGVLIQAVKELSSKLDKALARIVELEAKVS